MFVEPCLDFVLLGFGEFLVGVVEVTIELQQRDLEKGKGGIISVFHSLALSTALRRC